MPVQHSKAPSHIMDLFHTVQDQHHPHLEGSVLAIEFVDSKPYVKDRLNLGKVGKFPAATKLWLQNKFDFFISMCTDVWFDLLDEDQREAYVDLLLTRCQVEYEPNVVTVNGKDQVIKDEWGRVEYSDTVKADDEGRPVWKVVPLDILTLTQNIKRYGLWYEDLLELHKAIQTWGEE